MYRILQDAILSYTYTKAIKRHITKNSAAGKDLIKGSFILICISIEPVKSAANPKAAGCFKNGCHIDKTSKMAKVTLRKPIK